MLKQRIIIEDTLDINHYYDMTINPSNINWKYLSKNKNAIDLLTANQAEINWNWLSYNENAINLLTANQAEINWNWLSYNENAIDLLTKRIKFEDSLDNYELLNLEDNKIDWKYLSTNLSIFEDEAMPII